MPFGLDAGLVSSPPIWMAPDFDGARLRAATADGVSVCRLAATDQFTRYGALSQLMRDLLPQVSRYAPELIERHRRPLRRVLPDAFSGDGDGGEDPDVFFSLERRASRESGQLAQEVCALERFARDAVALCPPFSGGLAIVADRFDLFDRPSLRVLHRIARRPQPRLSLVASCGESWWEGGGQATAAASAAVRIAEARRQLFVAMKVDAAPLLVSCDLQRPPASGAAASTWCGALEPELKRCLIDQNYERLYLLAGQASDEVVRQPAVARLIALADVNIGRADWGVEVLRASRPWCAAATEVAYSHYLEGLILTKRGGDLDAAARSFQAGLRLVGTDSSPAAAFEAAWLRNGLALVQTMRARTAAADERERLWAEAFRLELDAFALVESATGRESEYLRFNLLANLAFLLEIMGRYEHAISFWTRAFEQYANGSDGRFRVAYSYRMGLLHWKAGRGTAALAALESSAAGAAEQQHPFVEVWARYGLGYVALQLGDRDAAANAFERGCEVAATADERTAGRWLDKGWQAARGAADVALPSPSPKLPAYFPEIDLEPPPERDMNRYLAGISDPSKPGQP